MPVTALALAAARPPIKRATQFCLKKHGKKPFIGTKVALGALCYQKERHTPSFKQVLYLCSFVLSVSFSFLLFIPPVRSEVDNLEGEGLGFKLIDPLYQLAVWLFFLYVLSMVFYVMSDAIAAFTCARAVPEAVVETLGSLLSVSELEDHHVSAQGAAETIVQFDPSVTGAEIVNTPKKTDWPESRLAELPHRKIILNHLNACVAIIQKASAEARNRHGNLKSDEVQQIAVFGFVVSGGGLSGLDPIQVLEEALPEFIHARVVLISYLIALVKRYLKHDKSNVDAQGCLNLLENYYKLFLKGQGIMRFDVEGVCQLFEKLSKLHDLSFGGDSRISFNGLQCPADDLHEQKIQARRKKYQACLMCIHDALYPGSSFTEIKISERASELSSENSGSGSASSDGGCIGSAGAFSDPNSTSSVRSQSSSSDDLESGGAGAVAGQSLSETTPKTKPDDAWRFILASLDAELTETSEQARKARDRGQFATAGATVSRKDDPNQPLLSWGAYPDASNPSYHAEQTA